MSDEIQQLESLKEEVLNAALPLITDGNLAPAQKFNMLMSVARSNGSVDAIRNAYNSACQIEENDIKVDALMSVVNEIEAIIEDVQLGEELQEVDTEDHSEEQN